MWLIFKVGANIYIYKKKKKERKNAFNLESKSKQVMDVYRATCNIVVCVFTLYSS